MVKATLSTGWCTITVCVQSTSMVKATRYSEYLVEDRDRCRWAGKKRKKAGKRFHVSCTCFLPPPSRFVLASSSYVSPSSHSQQ